MELVERWLTHPEGLTAADLLPPLALSAATIALVLSLALRPRPPRRRRCFGTGATSSPFRGRAGPRLVVAAPARRAMSGSTCDATVSSGWSIRLAIVEPMAPPAELRSARRS